MKNLTLVIIALMLVNINGNSQNEQISFIFQTKTNFLKSTFELLKDGDKIVWMELQNPELVEEIPNYVENKNYEKKILLKDLKQLKIYSDYSVFQNKFYVQDSMNLFKWELNDSTQTILGYSCKGATTTFRGRKYIAYYTSEIPLFDGPWKFQGLPGMILKVSNIEDGEDYSFKCVNITKKEGDISQVWNKYFVKNKRKNFVSWNEFESSVNQYVKKYIKSIQSEADSEGDTGYKTTIKASNYLEIFHKELQTNGLTFEY